MRPLILLTQDEIDELVRETPITSADYNKLRALQDAEIYEAKLADKIIMRK